MKIENVEIPSGLVLGPMAGVTDFAFRKICREFGLEMSYTEMVSSKGIYYKDKKTMNLLKIGIEEHPIGVQIFGSDPIIMSEAVKHIQEVVKYDILDINMGCPTPKIVNNGDGSALLKNIKQARKIVEAVKGVSNKPVTVKIRIGWEDNEGIINFAKMIEDSGADAISVHGRTRSQMYTGKANWDIIKSIKKELNIPVIGNGDIFTAKDAIEKISESGVDGIMIARGAQGNPWLMRDIIMYQKTGEIPDRPELNEIIDIIKKQLMYAVEDKGEYRAIVELRKHIGWYIKGIKNSAKIRNKVNKATDIREFENCINELLDNQ
ncbi:MAG: tRNA dihydrouridine synthase DusB [Clostridiales bacterium]|nr:tRNA dihydrouridine synthase DusB [Clostridiales bacterium]